MKIKPSYITGTLFNAIVLTALYAALTESFETANLITGFAVSAGALIISRVFFLKGSTPAPISLYYIPYLFFMIAVILKNAAISVGYIFAKEKDVVLIRHKTSLESEHLRGMLANAVTLTPGTVTADMKDDELEIMMLCKNSSEDCNVCKELENMIAHMDRRSGK